MHKMKVRALDGGGRFCEAEVEITVEDVNDNAPQFTSDPYTFTVFENTEINTPVARLYASDLDTGKISCIQYNDIFMSVLYVLVSVFPKIFCNFATVWPFRLSSLQFPFAWIPLIFLLFCTLYPQTDTFCDLCIFQTLFRFSPA